VGLTFCFDVSPADWITTSDLPWERLVTFGPAGFEAYARLRFLHDPTCPGQSENDVGRDEAHDERVQVPVLYEVLAAHTCTPDDCYFCLWEGIGDLYAGDERQSFDPRSGVWRTWPRATPAFSPSVLDGPKVVVPNRKYLLFRGPLSGAGDWGAADLRPGYPRGYLPAAFVWPADHAWCVAHDIDPHWAGIGADADVVDQLVADPRLDVVRADPSDRQPKFD
jgi:hypothetical protein